MEAEEFISWSEFSVWRSFLATSVFTVGETALYYPFWLLKTREQHDKSASKVTYGVDEARRIFSTRGLKGFYPGFAFCAISNIPGYWIYLAAYTWAKDRLGYHAVDDNASTLSKFWMPMMAGGIADVASVAFYVPSDVVVQRLQLKEAGDSTTARQIIRQIIAKEGVLGLFRGLNVTMMEAFVGSAVWWASYEHAKKTMIAHTCENEEPGKRKLAPVPTAACGFMAGTVTSVVLNPIDVVRLRLQTQTVGAAAHTSSIQCLKAIIRNEGWTTLLKGLGPRLLSRGPLAAISSLVYELTVSMSRNSTDSL